MIPAAVLAEQLALVRHIDALVTSEIVRRWRDLSPGERLSVQLIPELSVLIGEVATAYGEVSAVAAADAYDHFAELAGARLRAAAPATPVPPTEQVEKMARWATAPLRFAEPLSEVAERRVVGVTQKLAQQPGRRTTMNMAARDGVRFARVPQGKTCSFCTMLASRGAVYLSERTARSATRFHANCDCAVIAIHNPDDLPTINRELQEEWQAATGLQRDQLKAWRTYVRETYHTEPH